MSSDSAHRPKILVLAVGGCGCNLANDLPSAGIDGIEMVAANTDAQGLERSSIKTKLVLDSDPATRSGTNSDPLLGRAAAQGSAAEVRRLFEGKEVVLLIAGLGGGTGSGATPYFASLAKEMEILSAAVVTTPFSFEGVSRKSIAETGARALEAEADFVVAMSNDELSAHAAKLGFMDAFRQGNELVLAVLQRIVTFVETEPESGSVPSRQDRFRLYMKGLTIDERCAGFFATRPHS
jgi:cell division protein FtsZ